MTRSRRVTYDNLRVRDPEFVAAVDRWFARHESARGMGTGEVRPPMFQPFRLRDLELANRVVVSPMDMYCAADGLPGDFHLVHLGGKALGGAGLVMTEMVCVSDDRADHAGLHRHLHRRAGRAVAPDHRVRAPRVAGQDRHPARPLRSQGLDEADVGGHRRAAADGQLAGGRAVPAALPARRQPGAARADRGRPGRDPAAVRRRRRPRRRGRVRPARTALRARLPAVVVHLTADQPAHRRVRRVARRPAALPARGVRARSGRCGPRASR